MKLLNYEVKILKKIYSKEYSKKYSSFEEFLKNFTIIEKELTGCGEYLTLKSKNNVSCDNLSLLDFVIILKVSCIKSDIEFIVWKGKNCLVLEGYSFEDKWINGKSVIESIKIEKRS